MFAEVMARYGAHALDRIDVSGVSCMSIDLRAETGGPPGPDETCLMPAGTFRLSLYGPAADEPPVGEVRIWLRSREVRIVGCLTGRPGVIEIPPDTLEAAMQDPRYRRLLREWVEAA
jgi:hypothetical protein